VKEIDAGCARGKRALWLFSHSGDLRIRGWNTTLDKRTT
jgi:hypothetical protein